MIYYTAPGIIPVSICGNHTLITPNENIAINETAAFYCKCLSKGTDLESLVTAAKKKYGDVDDVQLRDDIKNFINELLSRSLIIGATNE